MRGGSGRILSGEGGGGGAGCGGRRGGRVRRREAIGDRRSRRVDTGGIGPVRGAVTGGVLRGGRGRSFGEVWVEPMYLLYQQLCHPTLQSRVTHHRTGETDTKQHLLN